MAIPASNPRSDESRARRFEQIVGRSAALEQVLEQVERVAPTGSTVLIEGELLAADRAVPAAMRANSAARNTVQVLSALICPRSTEAEP